MQQRAVSLGDKTRDWDPNQGLPLLLLVLCRAWTKEEKQEEKEWAACQLSRLLVLGKQQAARTRGKNQGERTKPTRTKGKHLGWVIVQAWAF